MGLIRGILHDHFVRTLDKNKLILEFFKQLLFTLNESVLFSPVLVWWRQHSRQVLYNNATIATIFTIIILYQATRLTNYFSYFCTKVGWKKFVEFINNKSNKRSFQGSFNNIYLSSFSSRSLCWLLHCWRMQTVWLL